MSRKTVTWEGQYLSLGNTWEPFVLAWPSAGTAFRSRDEAEGFAKSKQLGRLYRIVKVTTIREVVSPRRPKGKKK